MNFTEYLKLNLPTPTTVVDIDDLNENSIKIDQELKKLKTELETAGSDEEIQIINKKIEKLEEVDKDLQILINNMKEDVDKNQASISAPYDTGTGEVSTKHPTQVNASTRSKSSGFRSIVSASLDAETNANTSAIIASSQSKLNDTDPRFRRNTVMLASHDFEFDPSSSNDHKVVGGIDGELAWMLDTRNGEIYAKNEVNIGDKKLSKVAKSSTIVIANYDSHENSKASADIVIEKGEDAAEKINDAIQSLKNTGGEIKLMEGVYDISNKIIDINISNVTLSGIRYATSFSGGRVQVTEDSSGVVLKDFSVEKSFASGITLYDNSVVTITNIESNYNVREGINLSDKSSAIIYNVRCLNNTRAGISIKSSMSDIIISSVLLQNNYLDPQYENWAQLELGYHVDFDTSYIFATGAKIIDTTGTSRGVAIRGTKHALTNTQFVGKFKEKINDGGVGTQLAGNVGV